MTGRTRPTDGCENRRLCFIEATVGSRIGCDGADPMTGEDDTRVRIEE